MEEDKELSLEEAILEAERMLIEGLGTAEKEVVQEGSSKLEQVNKQEQLKKDIAWLERRQETESKGYGLGDPSARIYRKRRMDYEW